MKVLVTGASGFLGSHVAEQLAALGADLRLLLRRSSSRGYLRGLRFELAEGDLRDAAALRSAVQGVECVVHLAGLATLTSAYSEADYMRVNAHATAQLAQLAAEARVRRFVYVSSLAAQGPSDDGRPNLGRAPHPVSAYGRSKLAGEAAVLGLQQRMSVAVLRPPVVYGPRDRALVPVYRIARRGVLPVLGDGGNLLSWVYVDDAAAAIVTAAKAEGPSGGIYTPCDGELHTWRGLVEAFAAATGRRVRVLPTPPALYWLAGQLAGAYSRLTKHPLPMSPDQYRHMRARYWVCDNAAIERDLGWQPKVAIREGFARTLSWYRQNGWL